MSDSPPPGGGSVPPPARPERLGARLLRSAGLGAGCATGAALAAIALFIAFSLPVEEGWMGLERNVSWAWVASVAAGLLVLVWAVRSRRRDFAIGLAIVVSVAGLLATACFSG
ncbi:MAG: hypothetical protein K8T90_04810 [Planctomycetes bacterium]|nr:hypothetical protein [Planctomycetota bacterium]